MILSRPETGQAFAELIAALDAETQALNRVGSKVALAGVPKNATKVMRLAGERARLRDHVKELHKQWQQLEPTGLAAVTTPPALPAEVRPAQKSPLNRTVKGLSVAEAAEKLMVSPQLIKDAIASGKLTAYRRVSGTWKILYTDLVDFYRKHGAGP